MYSKLMEKLGFYNIGEKGYLQLDVEQKGIAIIACTNLDDATVYINGEEHENVNGLENVLGTINNALS